MAEVLVTGSLAFDYIMRIGGRFSERLSGPAAAGFSAAFIAPSMRRSFGGCAGNIAYGLRQLGGAPLLMAAVGEDFAPYRHYLTARGIGDSHLLEIKGALTAQAFVISDDDDSQLIFFHPGATDEAHRQSAAGLPVPPQFATVSPNGREGMLRFGRELAAAKTPFIFDPGQAVGLFSDGELEEMVSLCQIAIFNHDEYAYCRKKTDAVPAGKNSALIITRGDAGSEISAGGKTHRTAAVKFGKTADTTGCGDAYRAGLIYGALREWKWPQIIQFASVVAGVKAECTGGQGYEITAAEAEARRRRVFGKH
ncbi:MAG: carbohydrate kinase family protein [Betaproteobacteria bacterium]|nr:carbohydrate kinase family protein [Betaproteobacteria bacterium]